MNGPIDITGSWRGYYEQDGGRHGISMQVVQRGASFVGRMRDEDTLLSGTAEISHVEADGDDTVIEWHEMETMGVLPEFSIIEGTVTGERVGFDKAYQGTHQISVWLEGHGESHHDIPEHRVRYDGQLDELARRLTGRWCIPASDEDYEDESGAFELLRQ